MSETKQQQIERLTRLLHEAQEESDRYQRAIRFALGEMQHGIPNFMDGYVVGGPAFWWRRTLRELAWPSR